MLQERGLPSAHGRFRDPKDQPRGVAKAKVWVWEVWVWEDRSAPPLARRLVAREMEGGEIKVSWTNAPKEMSDEELAYMQGQRHWIERVFEDAKQASTGHGAL